MPVLPKPAGQGILSTMAQHLRITINQDVCGGRPIISGTRMRVADVLGMLAGGASEAEITADFPYLTVDDVRACLAYAADAIDHRVIAAAA